MSKKNTNNHGIERVARVKRAKTLRTLTGLSRHVFARETGIPLGSLQHWENESGNGLTLDGAERLIRACSNLGVYASFEWLMHGLGTSPVFNQIRLDRPQYFLSIDEQTKKMQKELTLFLQENKEAIDYVIPDDSMASRFIAGEWAAGIRRYKQDIESVVGYDCIVLTEDGKTFLRYLKKSDLAGHYTLLSSNHLTNAAHAFIYDVKLVSAAPVIWTRRKDLYYSQ